MIKCTNGMTVIEVTEGAYNTIFKDQGYRPIVDEVKTSVETPVETPVEDNSEDESEEQVDTSETDEKDEIDSLLEKPISQWSNNEVKAFAEAKEIDITGTKNVKEAKNRIKKFLEDAE